MDLGTLAIRIWNNFSFFQITFMYLGIIPTNRFLRNDFKLETVDI